MLEQERILALTPAASMAGLEPGMRRASALALAPDAQLLDRDPDSEIRRLHEAALALLQYTPQLALREPDALLLDIGASLQLFGGPRRLARHIRASLATLQLRGRLGMAPTAQAAWLLAQGGGASCLQQTRMVHLLDRLPLQLLPEALPQTDWLQGLGCATLAELRQLPRAGLQRRTGTALLLALDRAYGQASEAHRWYEPPPSFATRIELMDYVEHTDALMHVAGRLAEQLSGWLHACRRAVRAITLTLEHERGRHARPPSVLTLAMAEPVWHSAHLLLLLRERLDRLELAAPVIAVALDAQETVEPAAASESLFPEPGGNAADHARLLDLLAARLGADAVRQPDPQADHRPEAANQWQAAHHRQRLREQRPAGPLDRPLWLVEPARALQERHHRPVYQGQPLRLVRGPERIESGWWDATLTQRDYFVAEDEAGARYWLYREHGERWFLHGLYG